MGWIIADVCYVCVKVIDGGRMRVEQKKGKVGGCDIKEEVEISNSDLARLQSLFLWRERGHLYLSLLSIQSTSTTLSTLYRLSAV
jgi:hypothetical protein